MSQACYLAEPVDCGSARFSPQSLADMDEAGREEYWASLALRHCAGLGARSQARLLKAFESAAAACRAYRDWPKHGIAAACAENFKKGQWRTAARKEWDGGLESSAKILLWASSEYPECLRQIIDAPILLYYRGDISLFSGPCIAIVGTRNPTMDGLKMAAAISASLSASGLTVVSGMALGIDREVHAAALPGIGRSIGVLGAGIDVEYPKSNSDLYGNMRKDGLLLSEFSPGASPVASNFPIRNRIISGLSLGVVVIEAANHSGSLITARMALEQNREVFAVPGSPFNTHSLGCQNLIRQGARAVFGPDDILLDLAGSLRSFGIRPAAPEPARKAGLLTPPEPDAGELAPTESSAAAQELRGMTDADKTLAIIRKHGRMHVDALLEQSGLDSGQLSAALLALEMLGQIRLLPGSYYELS